MKRESARPCDQQGFTLIEAVVVIVITGIVAAMTMGFIRAPMVAYADTARRAELTDIADTAARRLARELRGAVPNSVRITTQAVEFVPERDAGIYRAEAAGAGYPPGDRLEFGVEDLSFDVLGPPVAVPPGSQLIVGALAAADIYDTPPKARRPLVASVAASNTVRLPTGSLPLDTSYRISGNRFHIGGTPVSYFCDLSAQTLWRYADYGFQAAQPIAFGTSPGEALATHVSYCAFGQSRDGLVTLHLSFTHGGETVTLLEQVNLDNAP